MTNDALIGYTGFVGSTLAGQHTFSGFYNSKNIEDITGKNFNLLVCAGAPGQKWLANKEPEKDQEAIERLIKALSQVSCTHFILISTVDVFADPRNVDETSEVIGKVGQAYGTHRRKLEQFCLGHFKNTTVIRLPALVGKGLRKNAIFDLAHHNQVDRLQPDAQFQFYPVRRLWSDIEVAVANKFEVLHLTAAPVRLGDVAERVFTMHLDRHVSANPPPLYDFRTSYAQAYGAKGPYQVETAEVLDAISEFKSSLQPREVGARE